MMTLNFPVFFCGKPDLLSLQEVIHFSGEMELGMRNLFPVTLARLGKDLPTENQNLPGYEYYCW